MQELYSFLNKIAKSDSDYFFAKAMDQIYLCIESNAPRFTEFLDPVRRDYIHRNLGNITKYGIFLEEDGGYPEAERKMLGFSTGRLSSTDFPIARIRLDFDTKHATLTHGDFLGALMGLGLDRSALGDIVLAHGYAVAVVSIQIEDFVLQNLFKVGKIAVSAGALARDDYFFGKDDRVNDSIICSSLRLDSVLAAAFRLSRSEVAAMVKSGKVFINWQEASSGVKPVKEGDMLTLRRFGRIQIKEFAGKSKKGHFFINILRF